MRQWLFILPSWSILFALTSTKRQDYGVLLQRYILLSSQTRLNFLVDVLIKVLLCAIIVLENVFYVVAMRYGTIDHLSSLSGTLLNNFDDDDNKWPVSELCPIGTPRGYDRATKNCFMTTNLWGILSGPHHTPSHAAGG